jgi:hypothetical protein
MPQPTGWFTALTVSFVVLTGAGHAATQEQIGSWVLTCPAGTPVSAACSMRASPRFFDTGGVTGDLEVQAQGETLVPVIAVRGLSTEMLTAAAALGGKAAASIQYGGGERVELNCAPGSAGYFCSPAAAVAPKLAAGLREARSVTVRVSVSMAGMDPLPAREKSLDLAGTQQALVRLRTAGPTRLSASGPRSPGAMPNGMMAMADKALKAAGYQNGMALRMMLAKYRGK